MWQVTRSVGASPYCSPSKLPAFWHRLNPGAREAMEKGALIGHPVQGIRVVLQDGQTHTVDSSDMAFRFAAMMAVRESILKAGAQVLEPIMSVEVRNVVGSDLPVARGDEMLSFELALLWQAGIRTFIPDCTPRDALRD